jgi:DNA-directed RNA polymerase subunit RPC12/RpoP
MPVRFLCPACHQLLSISTRKIGSEVDCPKCRSTILVPDPQQSARREVADPFEQGGLEQALAAISSGPTSAPRPSAAPPRNSPSAAELLQRPAAAQRRPSDDSLIVISRRTLYLQALLLAIVAVVAFLSGYAIGSAGR